MGKMTIRKTLAQAYKEAETMPKCEVCKFRPATIICKFCNKSICNMCLGTATNPIRKCCNQQDENYIILENMAESIHY